MLCVLFTGAGCTAASAQQAKPGDLSFEPYTLKTFDGREHKAELGRLWVRESRAAPSDRLIQLAFVRLRSSAAQPEPPIVFLAGGPGVPGIVMGQVPVYFHVFERLREISDVILLDQRGSGKSSPSLECPSDRVLPADVLESPEKALHAIIEAVRACAEHWRSKGVALASYNTNESADDLEDLRRALGAARLNLLGMSYGAELALAAVRRHGDRLNRVVLAGTRGPDHALKLPSTPDLQLAKLSRLAAQDPAANGAFPDAAAVLEKLLDSLGQKPLTVTVTERLTKRPIQLSVGKLGLQSLVQGDMSDGRALVLLPALLYSMNRGDYELFTGRMERLYNGLAGSSLMSITMNCSAGWSAERWARARREAEHALLGDIGNFTLRPEICGLVGAPDLGAEFRSPIRSAVPTLFVSGTLDSNTPPEQAEEVRRGFPNGVHLVVENAAHEHLPAAQVQSVVADFFKGLDVSGRTVTLPPPRFVSIQEAKKKVQ